MAAVDRKLLLISEAAVRLGDEERSVETGFACWPFFRVDPFLESLR